MAEEVACILIIPLSCERETKQELLELGISKSKFLLEILDSEKEKLSWYAQMKKLRFL